MEKISLVIIVVDRHREAGVNAMLSRMGITTLCSTPVQGTAGISIIDMLGLERSEKTLIAAVAVRSVAKRALRGMVENQGVRMPGGGIAILTGIGSVGGAHAMKILAGESCKESDEGEFMTEKRDYPFDLIVAIAQRDNSEEVMSAARKAGARGGTIVHAKGTGGEYAAKFFGVTIAVEKEMVLIVTRHEKKDAIMRAIMDEAGQNSKAVVFSIPVESAEGMAEIIKD